MTRLKPTAPPLRILPADERRHAAAMLAIFNHEIAHTTALYEVEPRSPQHMADWFAHKVAGGWPVIVAEDEHGQLLGFASYGTFRAYPAFEHTVEHSVYVALPHQRRGVGRALMQRLSQQAHDDGLHVMVGAIDSSNTASVALHQALGFQRVGHLRETGHKFGRWLDLLFYQRTLP